MPKLKTNRGAKKRFKKTGTGKILRRQAFGAHIMTSKARKRKRRIKRVTVVAEEDARRIRRLLP
ncbi:MAG: 50S ribosomal protein L35 [Candidatus Eisenbacteria bacterium]|nr:50S ribosomal protein L35 [Candidatus Eisenbacteria bacterium]